MNNRTLTFLICTFTLCFAGCSQSNIPQATQTEVLPLAPQAIYLDRGFDRDGKVTTNLLRGSDEAHDVLIDKDGKIVAVGESVDESGKTYMSFARYLSDGRLDTSFGRGGKGAFTALPNNTRAIAITEDGRGRLLIAGEVDMHPEGQILTVRYLPNGSLDRSFGSNGFKISKVNGIFNERDGNVTSIDIDSLNRIVVTASGASGSGEFTHSIIRFLSNGNSDTSFGENGIVEFLMAYTFGGMKDALIDSNDNIVMTARLGEAAIVADELILFRIRSDGSLDTEFGTSQERVSLEGPITPSKHSLIGVAWSNFWDSSDHHKSFSEANAITVDRRGNYIVSGYNYTYFTASSGSLTGWDRTFSVARFNQNGILDETFDTDGMTTIDFEDRLNTWQRNTGDIFVDRYNRLVIAGSKGYGEKQDFAIARLNNNGSLDVNFNEDGMLTTDFAATTDKARALAIDDEGRIIAAGTSNSLFALARYARINNDDGSLCEANEIPFGEVRIVACIDDYHMNPCKFQCEFREEIEISPQLPCIHCVIPLDLSKPMRLQGNLSSQTKKYLGKTQLELFDAQGRVIKTYRQGKLYSPRQLTLEKWLKPGQYYLVMRSHPKTSNTFSLKISLNEIK